MILIDAGGEEGIRTLEKLLTSTPLAGERLRPLGHLSGGRWIKEKLSHNQQPFRFDASAVESSSRSARQSRRPAQPMKKAAPSPARPFRLFRCWI